MSADVRPATIPVYLLVKLENPIKGIAPTSDSDRKVGAKNKKHIMFINFLSVCSYIEVSGQAVHCRIHWGGL